MIKKEKSSPAVKTVRGRLALGLWVRGQDCLSFSPLLPWLGSGLGQGPLSVLETAAGITQSSIFLIQVQWVELSGNFRERLFFPSFPFSFLFQKPQQMPPPVS